MAVPPRRISKSRKGKRNSHNKVNLVTLTLCSHCFKYKKSHHICACGYYKKKEVIKG